MDYEVKLSHILLIYEKMNTRRSVHDINLENIGSDFNSG